MDELLLARDLALVTAHGLLTLDAGALAGASDLGELVPPGAPVGIAVTSDRVDPRAAGSQDKDPDPDPGVVPPYVVASTLWTRWTRWTRRAAPARPHADDASPKTTRALASGEALLCELRAEGHPAVCRPLQPHELAPDAARLVDALHEDAHPLAVVIAPPARSEGLAGGLDLAVEVLERWARAYRARRVLLCAPRSFCAGVERAIEIVERALGRFGAPVYVRRQIVHNTHVVGRLTAMGAVFVDELDEVPDGAVVVLAAHGVAPAVREEAGSRAGLNVIDATCPLVAKVHREARRFASRGYTIALVGHADHEEVVGTLGEAPGQIHVVSAPSDVAALEPAPGSRVAYLTQTTLATDETDTVVEALRARFGDVVGPSSQDICYATQNRQQALRAVAAECDLVLVVGSANSSNTARLVELARREGVRTELVEDAGQLRLQWLDGARTIGLTAGASAPEPLVVDVVEALSRLGPVEVDERKTMTETVRFPLPLKVR